MCGPLREPFTVTAMHGIHNVTYMCYINNNGSSVMSTSELKMMHGQSPQGAVAEQGAHNFSVTSQCMDGPLWEPLFMPAYPVHPCTVNPNSSTKGNSLSPTDISNPRLGLGSQALSHPPTQPTIHYQPSRHKVKQGFKGI
ncbi:hypothetical protein EDD22DRAFT_845038 [Suillus occidentalis]|nr:hypothetical protein EDD22DRAFT_845038 [Suillus occidentalis]